MYMYTDNAVSAPYSGSLFRLVVVGDLRVADVPDGAAGESGDRTNSSAESRVEDPAHRAARCESRAEGGGVHTRLRRVCVQNF